MKRHTAIFTLIALFMALLGTARAQSTTYEYGYDAAGNRIRRAVLPLHKGPGGLSGVGMTSPDEGVLLFGTALRAFPNPTTGTVRLETVETAPIEGYRLYDARGVLLEHGRCGAATVTLDLSARVDGVYLLDVTVGTERKHVKIVKQ